MERSSSLGMTSTTCPRLSRKLPRSLNPSSERSIIRQGTLCGIAARWTPTLAPFLVATRLEPRTSCTEKIGTALSSTVIFLMTPIIERSEEHTSELQSRLHLVCRLLLEKKKNKRDYEIYIYSHNASDNNSGLQQWTRVMQP